MSKTTFGMESDSIIPFKAQNASFDIFYPAVRLGIKLKFKSTLDGQMKELWATLSGEDNTKKLNSLVDFLDGKDEQWTEQQPRRFLDQKKGRGRPKPSYTS